MGNDLLQRIVDALDVDAGADAGFASDGSIHREVADHMSRAVLEAWIRAVRVHGPSEDGPVEGGVLLVPDASGEPDTLLRGPAANAHDRR
jgi:hypothetical protein